MADGSITIDSRINNKGAYAELKELQAKAKSTAQQIAGIDKKINSISERHITLGNDLKQARQEASATAREYHKLSTVLDANNARGVSNDVSDIKRADMLLSTLEKQTQEIKTISAQYREQTASVTELQQSHDELTARLKKEQAAANIAADALAKHSQRQCHSFDAETKGKRRRGGDYLFFFLLAGTSIW